MTQPLPTMTDEEMRCLAPADDHAGFGSLTTARGHLPLKTMTVHTRIDGLVSETAVRQTFVNNLGEPLEATYIFPLPDRGAVTRFRMEVAGRVIDGVLKERGEARREYDEAIRAGHRAAITEEERPDVFTLRVGNLMPSEQATVHLTVIGPLTFSDGEATFRFPLVVAPRYIPGNPLSGELVGDGTVLDTDAVPDASRITPPVLLPGYPHPVRLDLGVAVYPAGLRVSGFRSSLHAVADEEDAAGVRRISVQPGERLNRDFILRFRVAEDAVRTTLTLKPDEDGAEGTFLLTLVPPADPNELPQTRDVIFVLDRSGSMAGWKLVAARRAVARMVDTLTDRDRLAIYAFDDQIEEPADLGRDLLPATDRNRFRAVEFLARVESRGGTEMAQPLDLAVTKLASTPAGRPASDSAQRERIIVLVTDGQVGNEDEILRMLAPRLEGIRIFTLGIDRAVNEGFLRRLAAMGGGSCEVVESEDRLDEVMAKIHRRIGKPVLTALRIEPAGLRFDPASIVPSRLPEFYLGSPLFLMGRYTGAAGGLAIQARSAAGRSWSETVSATVSDNMAIRCVWARGRVRELEDQYITGSGDHSQLEKQIVRTSLQFGVLCRFTAFVAVDRSQTVNRGGQQHQVVQPVEPAEGWAMLESMPSRMMAGAAYAAPEAVECFFMEVDDAAAPDAMLRASRSLGTNVCNSAMRLMRIARGAFGPDDDRTAANHGPIDLTPYRRRTDELLNRLQAAGADTQARIVALGVLAERLAELIEDMESTGVPATAIDPLKQLLTELRQSLLSAHIDGPVLTRLWSQVEDALRKFIGSTFDSTAVKEASRGSREQFWK